MNDRTDKVKRWRANTKQRLIESLGGACCICGYNKCNDALDFHHLDQTQKEFSFSKVRANIVSWARIVEEVRKCVLVCNRCHQEIHSSRIDTCVPETAPRFNEKFANYRDLEKADLMDDCPVCGAKKRKDLLTCSTLCASRKSWKVNWDEIDVVSLVKELGSFNKVGGLLNISAAAVSKRYKRVNRDIEIMANIA